MADDKNVLDFRVIARPLDELLQATANIVRYQFAGTLPGNMADRILVMLMKIARIDYKSILQLCDEKAVNYRLEHAASIPPLSRCIADALFTVVFLLDDIEGNSRRYWRAGWRETCEYFRMALATHGNDPKRRAWLEGMADFLWRTMDETGVQPDEVAELQIDRWPIPGRMLKSKTLSPQRLDFLKHLNDWYYTRLSKISHGSAPGLSMRGAFLMENLLDRDERDARLEQFKSDNVFVAITLVLALASEIQVGLKLELAQRARFVWTIVNQYWAEAAEVYDMRYAALL